MRTRFLLVLALVLLIASLVPAVPAEDVQYVAEVDGGSQYATLAEAVEAAGDGGTVRLLADDPDASAIIISRSVTVDGRGHSFAGSFILSTSSEGEAEAIPVDIRDIVFSGTSSPCVSSQAPESGTAVPADLSVGGCTFPSSEVAQISVSGCSRVSVNGCSFGSSPGTVVEIAATSVCDSVSVIGNAFAGSCGTAVSVTVTEGGSVAGMTVSGNSFGEAAVADVTVPSAVPLTLSARGDTSLALDDGDGIIVAVLSDGSTAVSGDGALSLQGAVSISGSSGMSVHAVGRVEILDYAGAVWFDASERYGISFDEGSSDRAVVAETAGMIVDGDTGSGTVSVSGGLVVSDGLDVGGTLRIPLGGTLTVNTSAVLSGTVVNLGTLEVYGTLSADVDNAAGTVNAHSGAMISGTVTGNPVVYPVPAVVTTVLEATAGVAFSIVLSTDEGTSIQSVEGPSWLALDGTVLSGTPTVSGTYGVVVTATSAEYTVHLRYSVVVSPAPEAGGSEWSPWPVIAVLVLMAAAIALICLRWAGRLRRGSGQNRVDRRSGAGPAGPGISPSASGTPSCS